MGQGKEQLSSRQTHRLERDRPHWLAPNWEIAPGLGIDYSASLRLFGTEGEVILQEGSLLWIPLHKPASSWTQNEKLDTLFQFRLPTGLPSGSYALRLVVYDVESLVPTVQFGVWETEVTFVL